MDRWHIGFDRFPFGISADPCHYALGKSGREGAVLTIIFEEVSVTGSTNADLLDRADKGAPEGLWLRADRQDGGRGRMGRSWESPRGNCYVSTIIRLKQSDPQASGLAFVAAVAVHEALNQSAPDVPFMLKWPNDILVGHAKICGMLLERRGDAVVVGVGVNLADHPTGLERPTTSLAAQNIAAPDPQAFVLVLADIFAVWVSRWRMGGLSGILAEWREYAHNEGAMLRANLPDGERLGGEYAGLSDDGALKLRLADGSIRAIHAGDIFVI